MTQWELRLNSIGDANCRPAYVEKLNAWLDAHADVLDEDARHKRATSPLQVFDVKSPAVRAALEDAPRIGESLCDDAARTSTKCVRTSSCTACRSCSTRRSYAASTTTRVRRSSSSARTRTRTRPSAAGGRYDGLVEQIGGPPTPAIGFGAGIERLSLALENEGVVVPQTPLDVFIVCDTDAPRERVLLMLAELRRAGVSVDTDYAGRSFKGQMTQAGRSGAETVVIVRADGAAVRRRRRADQVVELDNVVATLTA